MLASRSGRRRNGESAARGAAEHEVVAAAGAGVAAVEHELLGRQARLVRRLVEVRGLLDQLVPAVRRVDVDFDHARVGRDAQASPGAGRSAARSLRGSPAASSRARWLRPRRRARGSPPAPTVGGMKTYSRPSRGSAHIAVRVIQPADSKRCGARVAASALRPLRPSPLLRRAARRAVRSRRCRRGTLAPPRLRRRFGSAAADRRQRRERLRLDRADAPRACRSPRPRAANRAAGGSPAPNRPGSGSSARRAGTTGRSASARAALGLRATGSTWPTTLSRPWPNTLRRRSRSSGSASRASNGSTLVGSLRSRHR